MKNATKERSSVDTERDSFSPPCDANPKWVRRIARPGGETHAATREPNPEPSKNFAKIFRAKSIVHLK